MSGLPICPSCKRRLNDSDFFDPTFASDFSYVESDFKCLDCETEGRVCWDFKGFVEAFEKEVSWQNGHLPIV